MRDKKVRAWDKIREEYLYSDKFPSMWQFYKELENRGIRHWETQDYTGLKDKNGKEIYEGDILSGDAYATTWEVFYNEHKSAFDVKGASGYLPAWMSTFTLGLEVIGNIYENPELLR